METSSALVIAVIYVFVYDALAKRLLGVRARRDWWRRRHVQGRNQPQITKEYRSSRHYIASTRKGLHDNSRTKALSEDRYTIRKSDEASVPG